MEALWILSGSNDVMFVEYFAKQMWAYSDDGTTSWGAYGWRWRRFFGWDQLEGIIAELKANPASRRCVLAMWNAAGRNAREEPWITKEGVVPGDAHDFYVATHGGLDVPCNTHIYFDARGGRLNMTVCNRSNDAIWGCYGANAVHMSFLLEYMAMRIELPMGVYRQFSNNFHAYLDVFSREKLQSIADECAELLDGPPLPVTGPAIEPGFDEDLKWFMPWARKHIAHIPEGFSWPKAPKVPMKTAFFAGVVVPMFIAWNYHKERLPVQALTEASKIAAPDWRRACTEWLLRRKK
jgi:hypothetical protein